MKNKSLSWKILKVPPSPTLSITAKAKALKREGRDVLPLSAGEPDFPTPKQVKDAALKAIEENFTYYTPASGTPELKEAIAEWTERKTGVKFSSKNVVVSPGAKFSIYASLAAILNPGEKVLIISPYWVSYPAMVQILGGEPHTVKTSPENSFMPDLEELKTLIKDPRTKAIILNSPSNPAGVVYPKEFLKELFEECVKNEVFIISDEIYGEIVYQDYSYPSSLADEIDGLKEFLIVINGVSKTFSMTGWRIGWLIANEEVVKLASVLQSQSTSNPTSISQKAAEAALKDVPEEEIKRRVAEFMRRRDYLAEELSSINGLKPIVPSGAFYMFVNVEEAMKSKGFQKDTDFAEYLLEKLLIATVPGSAFGADGFLRISFATSMENLQKGVERLKKDLGEK